VGDVPKAKVQASYGKLFLYFIQNTGQMNEKIQFYEKSCGRSMFFTRRGIYLSFQNPQPEIWNPTSEVIKFMPIGANKTPEIIAEGFSARQGQLFYWQ
jgi:hypothetical protein